MKCEIAVIGAGSAGAIVATRMAQAGYHTVLIEAGPMDHHPLIHIPAGVRYLHGNPRLTFADHARTGPFAGHRSMAWPHGRVLGGSGSINGMIFSRGAPSDFDDWEALGCHGWGWRDVLPAFRRLENFRGPVHASRGTEGPLPVELPRIRFPVTSRFISAAVGRGHQLRSDINQGWVDGVGEVQMNRNGRWRASSARAFIKHGLRSGRLQIITNAEVRELLFDESGETPACIGLRFLRNDRIETLHATRQVVVSAGAIDSSALLLRAGIGPTTDLAAWGINTRCDSPDVGRNLQDHHTARLSFRLKNTPTINSLARFPPLLGEIAKWLTTGRGVLTTGVTAAQLYMKTDPTLDKPDICILFSPSSFAAGKFGILEREPGCSVTISLCRPHSHGRLTLASADPSTRPQMDANHFDDPRDIVALIKGIEEARAILSGTGLSEMVVDEISPGASVTCAALNAYIRNTSGTMFHYCGTCRMGADADAVVDPRLRVKGIAQMRVIDASIMPRITSGNINAPVMMIAEQGAKFLIEDLNDHPSR